MMRLGWTCEKKERKEEKTNQTSKQENKQTKNPAKINKHRTVIK